MTHKQSKPVSDAELRKAVMRWFKAYRHRITIQEIIALLPKEYR